MTENAKKKVDVGSIRIPEDVRGELVKEQAAYLAQGKRISMGEILAGAWRTLQGNRLDAAVPVQTNPKQHSSLRDKPEDPLQNLNQADRALVMKLIHLINTDEEDKLPTIRVMLRNYKIPETSDVPKKKASGEGGGNRR